MTRATIILIGSTKGGVGKSTMAINLALEGKNRGKRVLLMDTDEQATIDKFIKKRSSYLELNNILDIDDIESVIQRSNIPKFLRQNLARYDWIIIDTSGKTSEEFVKAGLFADFVLSPTTPCEADNDELESLQKILSQINTLRDANDVEQLLCYTFMNKVDPKTLNKFFKTEKTKVKELLANGEYPHINLMKQYITYYNVYQKMHGGGYGVVETKERAKGQFQVFVNEVCEIEDTIEK